MKIPHDNPKPAASRDRSTLIRAAALAILLGVPGVARPSLQPPGPSPSPGPSPACCGVPDWAVQSVTEVPSRVLGSRAIRVRVANVGAGTSLNLPDKIVWYQQIDSYFTQHTTMCGLVYTVYHNGSPVQFSSLGVPAIDQGAYTDLYLYVPNTPGTWAVDVMVVPMLAGPSNLFPPLGIPECYTTTPVWPCVYVDPTLNNDGHWNN